MPVVKSQDDWTLLGVLSKKDSKKAGTFVKDVMSTPPIAARPDNNVADAAAILLKHQVIPRGMKILTPRQKRPKCSVPFVLIA